jgi:predicted permease
MRALDAVTARWRTLFKRTRVETELDAEMEFHLVMRVEQLRAQGYSDKEARAMARREFGNTESLKEEVRDTFGWRWLEEFAADLRYGWRGLRRTPTFSITAVLTLALGILSLTVMFAIADSVLFRSLPLRDAERLVWLQESRKGEEGGSNPQRLRDYQMLTNLEHVAGAYSEGVVVSSGGDPKRLVVVRMFGDVLAASGIELLMGRGPNGAERNATANPVVVLTRSAARQLFGSEEAALNKTLRVDGAAHTVIGIAPSLGHFLREVDGWIPAGKSLQEIPRVAGFLGIMGRLKTGVRTEQAQSELDSLVQRLRSEYRETDADLSARLWPLQEYVTRESGRAILLFAAAAIALMLVICTNLAGLLLARLWSRGREAAIRVALGAERFRLARLFLSEALLLAMAGGLLGIGGAAVAVDALTRKFPDVDIPGFVDAAVDWRVLLMAVGATLLCALLFGLTPAMQFARGATATRLKEGGSGTAGVQRQRLRGLFVVGEIAFSTMLVICAGLLVLSFQRATSVPAGFQPEGAVSVNVNFSWETPGTKLEQVSRDAMERLSSLPGVDASGIVDRAPFEGGSQSAPVWVQGQAFTDERAEIPVDWKTATRGFFEAARVPVLAGELYGRDPYQRRAPVAVVNDAFARLYFGERSAIGKSIAFRQRNKPIDASTRWYRIVGVVSSVRKEAWERRPTPQVFLPWGDQYWPMMTFVVRGKGEPAALARQIHGELRRMLPDQVIQPPRRLETLMEEAYALPRVRTWLLFGFAAMSLLISVVGLYGLLAGEVVSRTQEFGVKLALGAMPATILRESLGRGMRRAVLGILVGLGLAAFASKALASFLFGVEPRDATTFALSTVVLIFAALLACYGPAKRAASTNPLTALRHE